MPRSLDAKKERLAELGSLLTQHASDGESLRHERDTLCRALKEAGVPRSEIARLGDLSIHNLKWILADSSSRRRASSSSR